jgi:hypothetical protein
MNILAISGRKESGKSTLVNGLVGTAMVKADLISHFSTDEQGKLIVPTVVDVNIEDCPLELESPHQNPYLVEYVYPLIKNYFLSAPLKEWCVHFLGLREECVYGNNDQKNEKTGFLWETTPSPRDICKNLRHEFFKRTGEMTHREIMEFWGTDVFRRYYPEIFTEICLYRMKLDQSNLAAVTDVRFESEIAAFKSEGAKVVRLTRNPHDSQSSVETALDGFTDYDLVVDNSNLTQEETLQVVLSKLNEWGWM